MINKCKDISDISRDSIESSDAFLNAFREPSLLLDLNGTILILYRKVIIKDLTQNNRDFWSAS